MQYRQVEGIDTDNFPDDLRGHPLLGWMGEDYVRFVAVELLARFRQQDARTEMLSIKCEDRPRVTTTAAEPSGTVRGVVLELPLQVLLQSSAGSYWRLKGEGRFAASGLGGPESPAVTVAFDVRSQEQVE